MIVNQVDTILKIRKNAGYNRYQINEFDYNKFLNKCV